MKKGIFTIFAVGFILCSANTLAMRKALPTGSNLFRIFTRRCSTQSATRKFTLINKRSSLFGFGGIIYVYGMLYCNITSELETQQNKMKLTSP